MNRVGLMLIVFGLNFRNVFVNLEIAFIELKISNSVNLIGLQLQSTQPVLQSTVTKHLTENYLTTVDSKKQVEKL